MKHKGRHSLRLLTDFGLELESVKYIVVQVAESGFGPKSVMGGGAGGETKRGPRPPFLLLWLGKLIGRYVCWFGRRDIVDRHL